MTIGIIAEYNPFHNGHLYHLKKIKELYPESTIILITNGYFTQRGEASIYTKFDKTLLSISYGIDLVVELPFPFATQSADFFARGSVELLHHLKVDKVVFGSEIGDISVLKKAAEIQNTLNKKKIKEKLKEGYNYPTALSKVLEEENIIIKEPNDILGVCYIRELNKLHSKIEPICIRRTNSYHEKDLNDSISSATSIRNGLKNNKDISKNVPTNTLNYLKNNIFIEQFYPFLKYKILSEKESIKKYQTVEEGIENRICKYITVSNSLEELILNIKTKRYTYNKLQRMFLHILCSFTKEEAKYMQHIEYIRILGFNEKGKKYLNSIKKEVEIPIITNYSSLKNNEMLQLEQRISSIYSLVYNEDLIQKELKWNPKI